MELKYEVIYDNGTANLTFSLKKQAYIDFQGEKIYHGQPERLAVVPGDFEAVQAFAPELRSVFNTLWTPEAIAAYKSSLLTVESSQ